MVILEVQKPSAKNKSHLKAFLYTSLIDKGFDVYIDIVSNSLIQYTKGMKGYEKVKFDLVVFNNKDPMLIIMVSPSSRRFTKSKFYGVPVLVLDHRKYSNHKAHQEVLEILTS